jgi:cytochrome c oxidase accessory protein FixG
MATATISQVGERDTAVAPQEDVESRREQKDSPLYAGRINVYPRAVHGPVRRIKWAVLIVLLAVYYLTPWIRWDRGAGAPDQAVLIDMPSRRAYFFWIEIWPQEVYYLTGLLILGALGLFLVTTLFGRVWCGYTCPQTVWTDLFMWIERLIQGDRNERVKLDRQPWTGVKVAKKGATHAAWLLIAVATGGAWIMYFNDAPTIVHDLFTGQAGGGSYFFVGLFTATTYVLGGLAREQVCTYMCPWPRFQAALTDEDSLVVTYQGWRGEPRGKHKKGESWAGRGDCIDCKACVAVCPTGIDIRDGYQLECIGCGLCVDACNDIMPKVDRPPNLITFDSQYNQVACAAGVAPRHRFLRPRALVYAGLIAVVGGVMLIGLSTRATTEISIQRDRNPLFVTLSDGAIRNGYTFKLLNMRREPRSYELTVADRPQASLRIVGGEIGGTEEGTGALPLEAKPDGVSTYRVYVTLPRAVIDGEHLPVTFELSAPDGATTRHEQVFRAPA